MRWNELKEKVKQLGIEDEDIIFIRSKIETESRAGITNIITELCAEKSDIKTYEIKTIFSTKY